MRTSLAAAMDLDPDPVELPLHRRAARSSTTRLGDARGGRGEHRQDRPEDLEANRRGAPALRPRHRDLGRPRRDRRRASARGARARRARRPPWRRHRPSRPPSAPCRSSPVSSRLRKSRLASVARPSSVAEQLAGARRPIRARRRLDLGDRAIDVVDRERRLARRRRLDAVDGGVADADAPLPRHAGEEPDARSAPRRARAAATAPRGSRPSRERELVAATSLEAATTSASSVMACTVNAASGG